MKQPDTIDLMPDEVIRTELRKLQAENVKLSTLLAEQIIKNDGTSSQENYWKAKYFESYAELVKANKGCRRMAEGKRKRKIADIMLAEEQQKDDDARELEYVGHISLHQE